MTRPDTRKIGFTFEGMLILSLVLAERKHLFVLKEDLHGHDMHLTMGKNVEFPPHMKDEKTGRIEFTGGSFSTEKGLASLHGEFKKNLISTPLTPASYVFLPSARLMGIVNSVSSKVKSLIEVYETSSQLDLPIDDPGLFKKIPSSRLHRNRPRFGVFVCGSDTYIVFGLSATNGKCISLKLFESLMRTHAEKLGVFDYLVRIGLIER